MFEKHFKLAENPFSLTPDPRFIYPGRSHEEALATLRYWVEHREGFVMVTGEVGTGKTTSLFRLIDSLEQRFEIAFITNSTLNTVELLEEVCRRFKIEGITPGLTKSALLQRLEAYLVRLRELQHAAILIIDEAQNFDAELLEEVRLLSNTVVPSGPPLLQIALVGQPELERKLSLEELRQLRQRIGVHYRIEPLSEDETIRYIRHRIAVAGGNPDIAFQVDAARQLYRYTRGLPREINQLASQSLLHAFVDGSPGVSAEHVRSAAWEMQFRSVLDRGEVPTAPGTPGIAVTAAPSTPPPAAPLAPAPVTPPPVAATPLPPAPAPQAPVDPTSDAAPGTGAAPPTTTPAPSDPLPIKTLPPLEMPAAAPRVTRVSRLGPLPETGARAEESKGSVWRRFGLIVLAAGLLAAVGWLLLGPKPHPPEDTSAAIRPGFGVADTSNGPGQQRRDEAMAESQSAAQADSAIMYGTTNLPHPGSAAGDSARQRLSEMQGQGGDPASGASATGVPPGTMAPPAATVVPPATPPVVAPRAAAPESRTGGIPADAWRLQVASFRDSSLAEREGRRLAGQMNWGYELVRNRLRDQSPIYAVLVGPFESKSDADSAGARLDGLKLGFKGAIAKPPRGRP